MTVTEKTRRATVVTLVVLVVVIQTSVATNRLFFKGKLDGEESSVHATVGENVMLDCEAGGSPSPTIHWLHHGRRIQQGSSVSWMDDETFDSEPASVTLGITKSPLFLDCLQPGDAGQYTCVADTPTRRISRRTTVSVELSPVSDDCAEKRTVRPARVFMWTSHRFELENSDVQLFCRADGDPAPTITWLDHNGVTVKNDSRQYEVLSNGDLLIRQVSWANNMGLYRCVADNVADSDQVGTFLYPTTEKNE